LLVAGALVVVLLVAGTCILIVVLLLVAIRVVAVDRLAAAWFDGIPGGLTILAPVCPHAT
jgi:hypothetical protein